MSETQTKTEAEMLEAIKAAEAKGFIPMLDTESVEYNYDMAMEFEKLDPQQQEALAAVKPKDDSGSVTSFMANTTKS